MVSPRSRDERRLAAAATAAGRSSAKAETANPENVNTVPVVTAQHIWTARSLSSDTNCPPLIPFKDLPLPKSDLAKLSPYTIRWQFTGNFSLKREEGIARGSLVVQVARFLQFKNASTETILVNFPRGVGKGRFVDVHVHHSSFAVLAEAPLVYRGARLRRHLVGPALPNTALVVAISGYADSSKAKDVARDAALFLQPFATVHDVWQEFKSSNVDPEPRPTNRILVLVETEPTPYGGRNLERIRAIPGYAMLGDRECVLEYEARMEWCTRCRSRSTKPHPFEHCPRRRCFNCGKLGHIAVHCPDALIYSERR